MLGIGLGGFSSGFERGWGLGEKIEEGRKKRQERAKWDEAIAAGKSDYDAAVSAGTERPNDAPASLRYAMPRIIAPLFESGDVKGAQAAAEWLQSDETKQGARLFESGLARIQAGDVKGALTDLTRLGKLRGYGLDFELIGSEELPNGKWHLRARGGDGKDFDKEFSADEIGNLFATHLNGESAWKNYRERQEHDTWRRDIFGDGGARGSVIDRIVQIESGGNASAKNPASSATGAGQFIDSTWLDLVGRHKPELTEGKTPQQILELRRDPSLSREMVGVYAQENSQNLGARGIPETPETTYLAHFLGPDGAISVLQAAPNTPVARVLPSNAIQANPTVLRGRTAGQVIGWARRKTGAGGQPMPSGGAKVAAADQGTMTQPAGGLATKFGLSREQGDMLAALGPTEGKKQLAKIVFEERPTLAREFEYAKSQGFEGDQFDFLTAKQQAGAPTLERIRGRIARGEKLSAGEQKVYDDAIKLSLFDKVLLGSGMPPSTVQPALAGQLRQEEAGAIPPAAIEMLRADPSPEAVQEFEAMFGRGAAQRVLGG